MSEAAIRWENGDKYPPEIDLVSLIKIRKTFYSRKDIIREVIVLIHLEGRLLVQ